MNITAENIRTFVDYDSVTGRFTWKTREIRPGMKLTDEGWNTRFAGKLVAERRHRHGHLQIGLFCKNYIAHRIAWMWFYGVKPERDLDHKNGDPSDNRISNLRLATTSQNLMNSKTRTDNTSGVKGVSWSRKSKKWYAYIVVDQKMRALGLYDEIDDAITARKRAETELHGEFARAA